MARTPEQSFRQVARQYVDSRKTTVSPISMRHALLTLKTVMPDCGLSDQELIDLVAEVAVAGGRSVRFDALLELNG